MYVCMLRSTIISWLGYNVHRAAAAPGKLSSAVLAVCHACLYLYGSCRVQGASCPRLLSLNCFERMHVCTLREGVSGCCTRDAASSSLSTCLVWCQAAIPGLRAGDESFGQLTSQRPKLRRSRVFDKVSALAAVTKQEAMLETSRCAALCCSSCLRKTTTSDTAPGLSCFFYLLVALNSHYSAPRTCALVVLSFLLPMLQ